MAGDLPGALAAGTPGGIEAQELKGQLAQAVLETLPAEFLGCSKEDFEKLGFKFTSKTPDGVFWNCKFPAGWKKLPTDHSMWTDLIDDKGVTYANIFFKAAFYDYHAHISLANT